MAGGGNLITWIKDNPDILVILEVGNEPDEQWRTVDRAYTPEEARLRAHVAGDYLNQNYKPGNRNLQTMISLPTPGQHPDNPAEYKNFGYFDRFTAANPNDGRGRVGDKYDHVAAHVYAEGNACLEFTHVYRRTDSSGTPVGGTIIGAAVGSTYGGVYVTEAGIYSTETGDSVFNQYHQQLPTTADRKWEELGKRFVRALDNLDSRDGRVKGLMIFHEDFDNRGDRSNEPYNIDWNQQGNQPLTARRAHYQMGVRANVCSCGRGDGGLGGHCARSAPLHPQDLTPRRNRPLCTTFLLHLSPIVARQAACAGPIGRREEKRDMTIRRLTLALAALALLLSGELMPIPDARAVGVWTPVAPMSTTRHGHTATLLPDGQVLVTGGVSIGLDGEQPLASAERYDPVSGRWFPVAPMGAARSNHTATLLHDGRVFVADGAPSGRAEIYDPAADRWTPAGLKNINLNHTVTLLPDGQILSTGGTVFYAAVERYDPATNRWTAVAAMVTPRSGGQSATLLRDGRVLVSGGNIVVPGGMKVPNTAATTATEIYDPTTDTWTPAAAMATPRSGHKAFALADGQILVIGADGSDRLTAERYDPAIDRWTPAAPLSARRSAYTATLLPDGQVLAVGGEHLGSATADAPGATTERYDPATDRWTPAAPLSRGRAAHAATLLQDGRLFIVGGITPDPATPDRNSTVATAEFYADDSTPPGMCFPETGHCTHGTFFTYWQSQGLDLGDAGVSYRESLALFGYPLSDVRIETLEDGHAYQVQYFERVRLEYHPENPAPYDILLGQFGRRIRPADPPAEPLAGQVYFAETGHNLGDGFLDYWRANGGLAQFGFPISEVFEQELDGQRYRVQYFERARFEHHPDNPAPYDVLLGQFGRQILAEVDAGR